MKHYIFLVSLFCSLPLSAHALDNNTYFSCIYHMRTMHTSSGKSYLIINGKNEATNINANQLWALPLINKPGDATDGLIKEDTHLSTNSVTYIGNSPLTINPNISVSHLEVYGDTVYALITGEPDESGIFCSQALCNAHGDIVYWTSWTKRASPVRSATSFSFDPITNQFVITDNTTQKSTIASTWHAHKNFSDILHDGCFSALDLDQATRGFLHNTADRYALFGGMNCILFTRISHAHDQHHIASPQTIITDFYNPENLLFSPLPAETGPVTKLEYSRRENQDCNFFFAGTRNGLFVFADKHGNGFLSNQLSTLTQPPFSNGTWHHIPTIAHTIIDIKCAGNALYILTSQITPLTPFKTVLYAIPFSPLENNLPAPKNSISTLFAPQNIHIIAESGVGIFSDNILFHAIGIVSTSAHYSNDGDSPEKREQLILATNNGLFATNAPQETKTTYVLAGVADACNQTQAAWKLITDRNHMFNAIGTIDTPVQHALFPISYTHTKKEIVSTLHYLHGAENAISGANSAEITVSPTNNILPGRINYLWTDGNRSFCIATIIENSIRKNRLLSGSSITNEHTIIELDHTFFWVKNIGVTGIIMAGTDQGIITLD